ncbi:hypothetical protein VNO78_35264 [Psophocarpus tetragonolobus]
MAVGRWALTGYPMVTWLLVAPRIRYAFDVRNKTFTPEDLDWSFASSVRPGILFDSPALVSGLMVARAKNPDVQCMLGWRFSVSESPFSNLSSPGPSKHRNLVPVEEKLLLVRVGSYPSIVMAVQSRSGNERLISKDLEPHLFRKGR